MHLFKLLLSLICLALSAHAQGVDSPDRAICRADYGTLERCRLATVPLLKDSTPSIKKDDLRGGQIKSLDDRIPLPVLLRSSRGEMLNTLKSRKAGPGDGSGGGTGVQFNRGQCPIFLDLLMLHPEIASRTDRIIGRDCGLPEETYPEFEGLRASDKQAIERAVELIERAQAKAAGAVGRKRAVEPFLNNLKTALRETSFLRTSHLFEVLGRYVAPEGFENRNAYVGTVALYLPQYGVLISSPAWDSYDRESQALILIHEALRQFQISSIEDLSDHALQLMVAHLAERDFDIEAFTAILWTSEMVALRYSIQAGYERTNESDRRPEVANILKALRKRDDAVWSEQAWLANQAFAKAGPADKRALIEALIKAKILRRIKWKTRN